ncbi:hypothetical protein B0T25DRAFT_583661 [Lasiosphaeria hispida]|uniref:Uncharacterized protein n=1 Tax=Lasiosphaeria hispida TaxID=260671 RepID=A0AAJ0MAV0_9PEZI|nr:hypothetical protein B0T25DRAFT_583661 [Lasiosphaeria hispida]
MGPQDQSSKDALGFEKTHLHSALPMQESIQDSVPSQIPRRRRTGLYLTFFETLWVWSPEIVSCIVGILIFVAIIIILRVFDGKEQPELVLGLTINSILQYLTSFAKLALFVPIVEGLSQLKWLWFASEPRSLREFQLYDEATRGGLGIFKLLFRLKGLLKSPLLWLASSLLISGIFTSAVTQQVVTIESDLALSSSPDAVAVAPRASIYSRWNGREFELEPNDQLDLEQVILDAAYLKPTTSVQPLDPNCTTADCLFPRFGTLAICANTTDATGNTSPGIPQLLGVLANATIANLNNRSRPGYIELPRSYLAGGSIMGLPSHLFSKQTTAAALADIMFIYTANAVEPTLLQPRDLRFVEVILYACVKGFDSHVAQGVRTTEEIGSTSSIILSGGSNMTSLNGPWNLEKYETDPQVACSPGVAGLMVGFAPPEGVSGKYQVDLCTALMTSSVLNQYMAGFIALKEEDKSGQQAVGMISSALGIALYGGFMGDTPSPNVQVENLRGMASNMANGLTNMIRSKGASYTNSSGAVLGEALSARAVVRVRWAWLALLAAQLLLAIVFLIGVIVTTHRDGVQVIKSSAIATLCVLEDGTKGRLGPVGDVKQLSSLAGDVRVKLRCDGSLRLADAG